MVGDDLVWSKGYGTIDAQHTVPASSETIYSICSISKLFTAVALMQQYEAGKVRLDEPITTYLPWAKLKPLNEDSGPVTVSGILSHSAGLPREVDYPYWTGPDFAFPTQEEIKKKISDQSMLYQTEHYDQYSNLGLTLAGEILEAVTNTPYAEYIKLHILDPLKLYDTRTYYPKDLLGKQLAVGFGAIKRDGTRDQIKPFDTKGITPAAGYTSTVVDLGKFASWQFRLLRTGQFSLLKSSTLHKMQRVQFMTPDSQDNWGLGFNVMHKDGETYVGHDGRCPGYCTDLLMRNSDEIAVIVLMNAMEDSENIVYGVYTILDKRKGYKFKDPAPASNVNLELYSGRYSGQPVSSEFVITPWAGGLALLSLPSEKPAEDIIFLKPKGGDVFKVVRDDGSEAEEYLFKRDASGNVIGFVTHSNLTKKI